MNFRYLRSRTFFREIFHPAANLIPVSFLLVSAFPFCLAGQGWINPMNKNSVVLNCGLDSLAETASEREPEQVKTLDPEQWRDLMIRKYGKKKGPMIADGRIWFSISTEMALDSRGKPESRKISEGSWGINETWYYPGGKYLYFENGRLAKWKD